MDCVDDAVESGIDQNHREIRELEYAWEGIDSNGDWTGVLDFSGASEYFSKGVQLGSVLRYGAGFRHGLYSPDREIWTDTVGSAGDINPAAGSSFGSAELRDLYIAPILFSPFEWSGSNHNHRINFNSTQSTTHDPPLLKYQRSDNFFVQYGAGQYTEARSGGDVNLRSHIPLVAAWDATSGNTVFVSVDTGRSLATQGEIRVHPGFIGSYYYNKIREGSIVSDNRNAPADSYGTHPTFAYTLKTDVTPAVACADTRATLSYNCLLAWQDRGIPDGKILYTYFRINLSTNAVVWRPGTPNVWVRSGSNTVSNLSAAYFEGKFWLAWKKTEAGTDVAWTNTSTYTGWSTVVEYQVNWVQIRPWKADPVFTGVQRQGVEEGVVSVRSFD